METGLIGLGSMGFPMARNLLQAGHRLTVYNRTRSRAEELAKSGAQVVTTPAAACAPGVVMSVLSDDAAVESCVWGEGSILNALPQEGVHICLSTISTDLSRRLAETHSKHGQHFIAAPVFGRPDAAAAARLIVVAAGSPVALERCKPLLEPLGRKVFVLGPDAPAANTLKLAGNFLLASMLETLAEAFALLRKSNVDPGKLLEIVNGGLFQSPVYENYGRLMLEERFEPAGFALRLGLKDVRLVLRAGETAAAPLPIASLVHDRLLSALARGQGELDWSSLSRVAAASAGLDH